MNKCGKKHCLYGGDGTQDCTGCSESKVKKTHTCCLCGKKFSEYGNDPWPLMLDGICCDACNYSRVLPARLARAHAAKPYGEEN